MVRDIYISFDCETNGPVPGLYSMLSIGCAAYRYPKDLVSTFERNLEVLPDAKEHPDTMKWWEGFPEAYAKTRENQVAPKQAMTELFEWSQNLPGKVTFAAFPCGFDFTFLYWYMMAMTGINSWVFSCVDIKTYAMALIKKDYRQSSKKNLPRHWFDEDLPHTHGALDDAIEQGAMFMNMLIQNSGGYNGTN